METNLVRTTPPSNYNVFVGSTTRSDPCGNQRPPPHSLPTTTLDTATANANAANATATADRRRCHILSANDTLRK